MSELAKAESTVGWSRRRPSGNWWLLMPVMLVILLAVLFRQDPLDQDLSNALASPSMSHPLGTDQFGRDLAARLAGGARLTLTLSLIVVGVAASIGTALGLLTVALPGSLRWGLDRSVDVALGLPSLLLALALVGALGAGQRSLVIALSLGLWPWYARLARDYAASTNRRDFVQIARAGGIPEWRVWATHVAPHVVRRLVVVAALDVGYTIVAFAGMSYLGLGAAPPTPELGVILKEGQDFVFDAPWLLWAPAATVVLLVLPFVLASEGLHERGVVA